MTDIRLWWFLKVFSKSCHLPKFSWRVVDFSNNVPNNCFFSSNPPLTDSWQNRHAILFSLPHLSIPCGFSQLLIKIGLLLLVLRPLACDCIILDGILVAQDTVRALCAGTEGHSLIINPSEFTSHLVYLV